MEGDGDFRSGQTDRIDVTIGFATTQLLWAMSALYDVDERVIVSVALETLFEKYPEDAALARALRGALN